MKPTIKRVLIGILLFVVILLFFGVLLYDYIPLNQTIPSVSEYEAPEEVKAQLKEIATEDTSNVILTYEVSDSDLGVYEDTKSYDKGKANPFSSYMSNSGSVTSNNANGATTTGNQAGQTTQNPATSSDNGQQSQPNQSSQTTNTFYEDTTTK